MTTHHTPLTSREHTVYIVVAALFRVLAVVTFALAVVRFLTLVVFVPAAGPGESRWYALEPLVIQAVLCAVAWWLSAPVARWVVAGLDRE